MIVRVNESNIDEYEQFIKNHPKGLFQHSSKWAKVKSAWKLEALMLKDESGKILGSAAVLIRFVPVIKYSLFYVCRGFVADENDFNTFDKLFSALLELGKEYKAYCIKIDPEIVIQNEAYKKHLLSKGFKELNPGCMDFENVQPRFVYCFDYNNLSEEELLLTFKADYRNRIRKAPKKALRLKSWALRHLTILFASCMKQEKETAFPQDPKPILSRYSTAWVKMQGCIWPIITDRLLQAPSQ